MTIEPWQAERCDQNTFQLLHGQMGLVFKCAAATVRSSVEPGVIIDVVGADGGPNNLVAHGAYFTIKDAVKIATMIMDAVVKARGDE